MLSPGVYTITWNLGSSDDLSGNYNPNINDCMNQSTRQLGAIAVNHMGQDVGPNTFTLSGLTAPGEVQICVSDLAGFEGNQVPVNVI